MLTAPQIRRGVYTAPYRGPHGECVVLAIDSAGCCRFHALAYREEDVDDVVATLWQLLDQTDPDTPPQRHLYIVR